MSASEVVCRRCLHSLSILRSASSWQIFCSLVNNVSLNRKGYNQGWILGNFTSWSFVRRQIVLSKSTSKNLSEILSNHKKHLCVFLCLQDKTDKRELKCQNFNIITSVCFENFWRIFWSAFWWHYLTPYKTPAIVTLFNQMVSPITNSESTKKFKKYFYFQLANWKKIAVYLVRPIRNLSSFFNCSNWEKLVKQIGENIWWIR